MEVNDTQFDYTQNVPVFTFISYILYTVKVINDFHKPISELITCNACKVKVRNGCNTRVFDDFFN